MGIQHRVSDRRWRIRFPIALDVRYRVVGKRAVAGHAQTVNISSRGMLMITDGKLVPGMNLKLAVEWPVRLNEVCGLALHAGGKVVRTEAGEVAVQFRRYELRTRSVSVETCSRTKLEA